MPLGEWHRHQLSLKYQRDLKNSEDTAREDGREQGRMEAKLRIVRNLIQFRELSDEQIANVSGLSLDAIRQLKRDQ